MNKAFNEKIKDRFYRVYASLPVDRVPDIEFGYWPQTIRRWLGEGLPLELTPEETRHMFLPKLDEFFGFEPEGHHLDMRWGIHPPFEERVVERRATSVISYDVEGVLAERFLHDQDESAIPHCLKFPVETSADWPAIKERFRWDDPVRKIPVEQIDAARRARADGKAIHVFFIGFYGKLRTWMGTENLSYAFYDYPKLVHEMVEHWAELCVRQMEQLPADLPVDVVGWWEDMAGKNGPLCSPEQFREFFQPGYRRVMEVARRHGCRLSWVDSDGNPRALIPFWLKEGSTSCSPSRWKPGAIRLSGGERSEKKFGCEVGLPSNRWSRADARSTVNWTAFAPCSKTAATSRISIIWCHRTFSTATTASTWKRNENSSERKKMSDNLRWKPDWALARQALTDWWHHKGLALWVVAPKDEPWENIPEPRAPRDAEEQWTNVELWAQRVLHQMSRRFYGGVAYPNFWTCIGGPGSLGLFLGAIGHPAPDTLWYEPVISDPDRHPPLKLDRTNPWWSRHMELIRYGLCENHGRYIVGFPDLIENIDTLAQLREGQLLLLDLMERPDWVKAKLAEINRAYFEAYEEMYTLLRDPWGGSAFAAFELWAPGRVAKVQCDFSCMISAEMFREFVVPPMREQCRQLDYAMYHLDGTQAMHQLDALLAMEELDAIEWTPQAGIENGGHPRWYDLYRRIKAAGKSVQALGVKPEEVEPLIDAVGAEGMYIMCAADNEAQARALLRRVGWKGEA